MFITKIIAEKRKKQNFDFFFHHKSPNFNTIMALDMKKVDLDQ